MSNLTPAQQRQQSNRTTDGKYATKQHSEAEVDLGLDQVKPTFDQLRRTITEEDLAAGYRIVENRMKAARRPISRDTPEDEQRFQKLVQSDASYRKLRDDKAKQMAQLSAYGRAYEQGVAIDPAEDTHFERIWSGELKDDPKNVNPTIGYSQDDVQWFLDTAKKDRQSLEDGQLQASELYGQGVSQREGLQMTDNMIATYQRALDTRGRSVAENVISVQNRPRDTEPEADDELLRRIGQAVERNQPLVVAATRNDDEPPVIIENPKDYPFQPGEYRDLDVATDDEYRRYQDHFNSLDERTL